MLLPDGTTVVRLADGATWSEVTGDGCSAGHDFTVVEPGVPDGIRVDELGNVWASSGDGVRVLSPSGQLLAHIGLPGAVGDLCFGGPDGRTFFVTAGEALFRLRAGVRDAAAVLRSRAGSAGSGAVG